MIQIQAVCAWRRATAPTELAFRVDDVDKGSAGPQLVQTYRVDRPFDLAADDVFIELDHLVEVSGPQNQMVEFFWRNWIRHANNIETMIPKF